jgi:hypothetical protein
MVPGRSSAMRHDAMETASTSLSMQQLRNNFGGNLKNSKKDICHVSH